MVEANDQRRESLLLQTRFKLGDDFDRARQFAQAHLDGNFPRRDGADQDAVTFIADELAGGRRQSFIAVQPP